MSVGYKLYREVLEFAPADWSASELVVAWVIADDANDDTRRSWIPLPLLCQRARLSERGVRAVLHRLGEGGYEFRVSHGEDKLGRPVYAAKGHAVDYIVPDMLKGGTLVPPMAVDNPPVRRHDGAANDAAKAARIGSKGGTNLLNGGTLVPPLPSDPLTIPSLLNGPDLTAPVESATQLPGQDQISRPVADGEDPPDPRRPGRHARPEDIAARQAAQSRAERERRAAS